jgi:hypothetical protein
MVTVHLYFGIKPGTPQRISNEKSSENISAIRALERP